MIALIDRAVEQVKAKLAVAEERAERDAALRADCLSFDDSHEGELIRRYETSSRRAFLRSLSEFYKARRETEEQDESYADDTTDETATLDPTEPTAPIATTCEPEIEHDDDFGPAELPSELTDVEPAGMFGDVGASDPSVLPSEAMDVDRGVLPSEAIEVDRGVLPSEAIEVNRGVLPSEAIEVDRGVLPSEASAPKIEQPETQDIHGEPDRRLSSAMGLVVSTILLVLALVISHLLVPTLCVGTSVRSGTLCVACCHALRGDIGLLVPCCALSLRSR